MIEKETIASIKASVDLKALVESRGVTLKKNGKGWFGLCPFHDDKSPSLSVNPSTNLFQCFGCGAAGDVIRFVELLDKVDFKEAVSRLSDNGIKKTIAKSQPARSEPLTVKEKKLLSRVVAYYQHTFTLDNRGIDYLKNERGITDIVSLKDFGAGYANGTLREILPQDEEIINSLKTIGILNAKGNETFYNCVTFPLHDQTSAVVNLYGRNIIPPAPL